MNKQNSTSFMNDEIFSTPPDDGEKEEVLLRNKINYDFNVLILCYDVVNYYDSFNLFAGMLEHIHSLCLKMYPSLTSQEDVFLCSI